MYIGSLVEVHNRNRKCWNYKVRFKVLLKQIEEEMEL